jgi:anti-sigma regulatory factor (Ser/Thr protein kinase)
MGVPPLIYYLKNDVQELSRLMDAVENFGRIHHLDNQTVYSLNLAVEEIITDDILCGIEKDRAREIEVRLTIEDDEVVLEISDDARPRNPLPEAVPALAMAGGGEEAEAGIPATLGIDLVRGVMDQMEYQPRTHGNRLILRKRLASIRR